jgi:hypothetical protein
MSLPNGKKRLELGNPQTASKPAMLGHDVCLNDYQESG